MLAIDGGATATRAALVDREGTVLGQGEGGPCGPLLTPESRSRAARHVQAAVAGALGAAREAGAGVGAVAAVRAGLTGVGADVDASSWLREALSPLGDRLRLAGPVEASSDLETALEGALGPGTAGVMVYAGTGSTGAARYPDGRIVRAGGYGYLIDDRGGGFDLGRMGLQAVVRAWDGRGPRTALEARLPAALGAHGWDGLRRAVYGAADPKALVAGLAPLVFEAAEEGDEVAGRILDEAARELGLLASALARRLDGLVGPPVPVRFAGRVLSRPALRDRVIRELAAACAPAAAAPGHLPPLGGAALLALESAGLSAADRLGALERLRRSLGPA